MRDLIRGALIGVTIATVVGAGVSTLTGVPGEPEHSIVRSLRCAPVSIKMPCLQPSHG